MDTVYDQLMAWVDCSMKQQGLSDLSDQARRLFIRQLISVQLITETPDLAQRLPPTLAKQLADAVSTLQQRLPSEVAARVQLIVRKLSRRKGAAR